MSFIDTIFAPITSIGGSVILIRISGKSALNVLDIIEKKDHLKIKANFTFFTKIIINNKVLDEILLTYFEEGKSFTGENVIEISIHGSKVILNQLLIILGKIENFRFAERGEFTKRAFLNGKIDLLQAESINQLIKSETIEQHRIAQEFLSGNVSKKYIEIRKMILKIIASFETLIDFSDEDIPKNLINNINYMKDSLLQILNNNIKKKDLNVIFDGLSIAIIGKPNAGKSSLMNALVQKDISIVSSIEGTTRDIIKDELFINNIKIHLYDTAGIREDSVDEIENIGIKKAKNLIQAVNMKICIIDVNNFDFLSYKNLLNELTSNDLVILNKIDLINDKTKIKKTINEIKSFVNNIDVFPLSLKNDDISFIVKLLESKFLPEINSYPLCLNEKHFIAVEKMIDVLENINLDSNLDFEIEVEKLYSTINILKTITGEIENEDILDEIFSSFCIGK